jgi:hypothetical protein
MVRCKPFARALTRLRSGSSAHSALPGSVCAPGPQSSDAAVGSLLVLLSVVIFVYYTLWVIVIVRSRAAPARCCPHLRCLTRGSAHPLCSASLAGSPSSTRITSCRRCSQTGPTRSNFQRSCLSCWLP